MPSVPLEQYAEQMHPIAALACLCSHSSGVTAGPTCAELRKDKDLRAPGKVTPGVIGAAGNAYAVPVNAAPRPGQQAVKQARAPA